MLAYVNRVRDVEAANVDHASMTMADIEANPVRCPDPASADAMYNGAGCGWGVGLLGVGWGALAELAAGCRAKRRAALCESWMPTPRPCWALQPLTRCARAASRAAVR